VLGPVCDVGALDLPGIAVLSCCSTTRLFSIDRNFEPGPTLAAIENEKLNVAWFAPVMVGMPDEC
jgi:fatty-acyl-CoA synthase